jgi:hypothetical protein
MEEHNRVVSGDTECFPDLDETGNEQVEWWTLPSSRPCGLGEV